MALELYRRKQVEIDDNREVIAKVEEVITFIGAINRGANDNLRMGTLITDTSDTLISFEDTTDFHKLIVDNASNFEVTASITGSGSSGYTRIQRYNSSDVIICESLGAYAASGVGSCSMTGKADAGDYFVISSITVNPAVNATNTNIHFSLKASPLSGTKFGDV